MTKAEAIKALNEYGTLFPSDKIEAIDIAIEALKAEKYDEIVFDMNEFFSIVEDGKITVMRRGRGRVTVERPGIPMETTICSYGEGESNES